MHLGLVRCTWVVVSCRQITGMLSPFEVTTSVVLGAGAHIGEGQSKPLAAGRGAWFLLSCG